jgi:hypothetical protein
LQLVKVSDSLWEWHRERHPATNNPAYSVGNQLCGRIGECSVFTVFFEAFDSLPPTPWYRRLFIDAEPGESDGWAVVVRGEDRAIVGRTDRPWEAALAFNEADGSYRRFIVLATGNRGQAERIAGECRAFYAGTGNTGERLAACAGNPILPLLLTRFAVGDFSAGWRRCTVFNRKAGASCAA